MPVFALIPTGPDEARMLWVPWPVAGVEYRVERRATPESAWELAEASVSADAALATGLEPDDELRVAAFLEVGDSANPSECTSLPTTAAPDSLLRRTVVDGRGLDWQVTPDEVSGSGAAPTRAISSSCPSNSGVLGKSGKWPPHFRPRRGGAQRLGPSEPPSAPQMGHRREAAVRGAATLNMSLDGIPRSALIPARDGLVGYCSKSGWGCLEISSADVPPAVEAQPDQRTTTDWYDFGLTLDIEPPLAQNGLVIGASAGGGVELQLEYETEGWFVPTLSRIAARARPYVGGQVYATIDTTSTRIVMEDPVYTTPQIIIYTATLASVTTDFDLSAVVDFRADGPVSGQWLGQIGYSRTFEVGYNGQFYGPQVVADTPVLLVTPEFGDGSSADLWFGWRADANLNLDVLGVNLATASLSPTAGTVFVHRSTPGAPCNHPVSLAHARVDLGAKLEANLDLPGLLPRQAVPSHRQADSGPHVGPCSGLFSRSPTVQWHRALRLPPPPDARTDGSPRPRGSERRHRPSRPRPVRALRGGNAALGQRLDRGRPVSTPALRASLCGAEESGALAP
ncbi:MAG: hypothetical protein H6737_24145 [Alphaproteobacteria bacterium]|nr:hypothetical protein [Alphaproteobacteria bacterium]